jgi:hypothetical protein
MFFKMLGIKYFLVVFFLENLVFLYLKRKNELNIFFLQFFFHDVSVVFIGFLMCKLVTILKLMYLRKSKM